MKSFPMIFCNKEEGQIGKSMGDKTIKHGGNDTFQ